MARPRILSSTFARYQLGEIVGEGANGRVFRATDEVGAAVAVKVVDPERITTVALKRFRNEVEFCSRPNHSNIIRVLDSGRTDTDLPGYVMPHYPRTLRSLLPIRDIAQALRTFDAIAAALEYAHAKAVWHRDLKPENVLIADDGAPIVTDFGIAHFTEEFLATHVETRAGDRLANVGYAAPEQHRKGGVVDQRADVFALALLLNEMITGHVPRGVAFKTIKDIDPAFAFLDEPVNLMMSFEPERRPPDAGAVRKLITAHSLAADSQRAIDAMRGRPASPAPAPLVKRFDIVEADHRNGRLILKLNEAPPQEWITALQQSRGGYTTNFGPNRIQVQADELWLPYDEHFNQQNVNMTKQYVEHTNSFYRDRKLEAARKAAADNQRLQEEQLLAEARRLKVRTSLKI